MSMINTVLGPISSDRLGLTLVHEHIIAAYPGWDCDPLARPYDRDKIVKFCLRIMEPVKKYGVNTIIEATPMDLNRDVDVMKEISEKLQIHIICSTGRYTEANGKWSYLKFRGSRGADMKQELYESFMEEITKGIGRSDVKPGIIKVATGFNAISPCEDNLLRASAQVSKDTGIPIFTHTEEGTMGPEQAAVMISEGADPRRIMIGHMCGNPSIDYQKDVLSKNANIAFDRFGIEWLLPDGVRVVTLAELIRQGYVNQIMLSHDFTVTAFGRGGLLPGDERHRIPRRTIVNIFENIIPELKEAGITDEQIKTMTVDNPKRLFG